MLTILCSNNTGSILNKILSCSLKSYFGVNYAANQNKLIKMTMNKTETFKFLILKKKLELSFIRDSTQWQTYMWNLFIF